MSDTKTATASTTFTDEEKSAMKERARELKAEKRRSKSAANEDPEAELLAKLAEMPGPDRAMGERIHAIVKEHAPTLSPRTWYGMPAYARDGKIICFFQPAGKFKARYSTLGFNDDAALDDGDMWPTSFALKAWSAAVEDRVNELVRTATS